MNLSEDDFKRFGTEMTLIVMKAVEPINKQLTEHATLLKGASGDNGLCGNVADLKKRMRMVERISFSWNALLTIAGTFLGLHNK